MGIGAPGALCAFPSLERPAGSCGSISRWRTHWRPRPRAFAWPLAFEASSAGLRGAMSTTTGFWCHRDSHCGAHMRETTLVPKFVVPFCMEPARLTRPLRGCSWGGNWKPHLPCPFQGRAVLLVPLALDVFPELAQEEFI